MLCLWKKLSDFEKVKSEKQIFKKWKWRRSVKLRKTKTFMRYFIKKDKKQLLFDFERKKMRARSLANCPRKPKVPGSSPAATYVQRWAPCSNRPANI